MSKFLSLSRIRTGPSFLKRIGGEEGGGGGGDLEIAASSTGFGPDPLDVNMPLGVEAGDLLLAFIYNYSGTDQVAPSGWTLLASESTGFSSLGVYYRVADGAEGATVTFDPTSTVDLLYIVHRITGAAVEEAAFVEATLFEDAPNLQTVDPPSLAPSWGAEENLWITYAASRRSYFTVTAPTDYGGQVDSVTGTDGSGDVSEAESASAHRTLNAGTENPGVWSFTGGNTNQPIGATVAVRPSV